MDKIYIGQSHLVSDFLESVEKLTKVVSDFRLMIKYGTMYVDTIVEHLAKASLSPPESVFTKKNVLLLHHET
jgi:hypothetical protein